MFIVDSRVLLSVFLSFNFFSILFPSAFFLALQLDLTFMVLKLLGQFVYFFLGGPSLFILLLHV